MPKPGSASKSSSVAYIGIDPGVNGGLVAIYKGTVESAIPMPETELEIWHWFQGMPILPFKPVAMLEWINPGYKGSNKSSMSKLYGSYMALRAFLTAAGIPFETVMPRKWQSSLGIQSRKEGENETKWKGRLKGVAQRLYPSLPLWKEPRTEGKQKAIADALLLATYCQRFHEGKIR